MNQTNKPVFVNDPNEIVGIFADREENFLNVLNVILEVPSNGTVSYTDKVITEPVLFNEGDPFYDGFLAGVRTAMDSVAPFPFQVINETTPEVVEDVPGG